MTVAVSDIIGFGASVLLLIPPAKDQWSRFSEHRQSLKKARSRLPELRAILVNAWQVKREGFDGFDTLSTMLGAIGLVAAFVLKMMGL